MGNLAQKCAQGKSLIRDLFLIDVLPHEIAEVQVLVDVNSSFVHVINIGNWVLGLSLFPLFGA